jgi:hypothetical protein
MTIIAGTRSFGLLIAATAVLLASLAGSTTASAQTTLCVKNGKIVSINSGSLTCPDKQKTVAIPAAGGVGLLTSNSNGGTLSQSLSAMEVGDCLGIFGAAMLFEPHADAAMCVETEFPLPAGTLQNLDVTLDLPPGTSASYTFTVFVSGSATSLACTISGSNQHCNDTAHAVTVSDTETLNLVATPSTGPAPSNSPTVQWSVQF